MHFRQPNGLSVLPGDILRSNLADQPVAVLRRHGDLQTRPRIGMCLLQDPPCGPDRGHHMIGAVGNRESHRHLRLSQCLPDGFFQPVQVFPCQRGHFHRTGERMGALQKITLIDDFHPRLTRCAELCEHLLDRIMLPEHVRGSTVIDDHQDIGAQRFLQRRMEGTDECMRKLPDKANRIHKQERARLPQAGA